MVAVLCIALSQGLSAQVVWQQDFDKVAIGDQVFLFEDSTKQLGINDIELLPDDAFAQSDQRIINFGFSNSAHWLRF